MSLPSYPLQTTGSKLKRRVLHLYMLVPDSNMLVLIRSAVNNHLIVSLSESLLFILAFDILLC